jgi:hypothetical protein
MSTARDICTRALKELMYTAEGETPSSEAISDTLAGLNEMAARWLTQGLFIPPLLGTLPTGINWRGDWQTRTQYAVNDGVLRSGSVYVCTTLHTSGEYDRPGTSPNWSAYWTAYPMIELELADTWPLGIEFNSGVISMLAVNMAASFNVDPGPLTAKRASDGMTALIAAYMPIRPVGVDSGLTRMPSQIWPYQIDQIS